MQKQILAELRELKAIIAKVVGTSDLPPDERFSMEAINRAAKDFHKMEKERGEWVNEQDLSKYLKGGGWWCAKFIRTEFNFNACIKTGHNYLFNKKALQELNAVLKERNVNLERYIDYKRSEAEFKKKLSQNKAARKGKRAYELPTDLRDINTSSPPAPPVELVRQDLEKLKQEFFEHKMAEYIDVYKNSHAMMKFIYHFEKYLDPKIKKMCKKWCDDFNYANHALELITKKREPFVPVKEEEMIQL